MIARVVLLAFLVVVPGCSAIDRVPHPPSRLGLPLSRSESRGANGRRSEVYVFRKPDGTLVRFTVSRETFRDRWQVHSDTLREGVR